MSRGAYIFYLSRGVLSTRWGLKKAPIAPPEYAPECTICCYNANSFRTSALYNWVFSEVVPCTLHNVLLLCFMYIGLFKIIILDFQQLSDSCWFFPLYTLFFLLLTHTEIDVILNFQNLLRSLLSELNTFIYDIFTHYWSEPLWVRSPN